MAVYFVSPDEAPGGIGTPAQDSAALVWAVGEAATKKIPVYIQSDLTVKPDLANSRFWYRGITTQPVYSCVHLTTGNIEIIGKGGVIKFDNTLAGPGTSPIYAIFTSANDTADIRTTNSPVRNIVFRDLVIDLEPGINNQHSSYAFGLIYVDGLKVDGCTFMASAPFGSGNGGLGGFFYNSKNLIFSNSTYRNLVQGFGLHYTFDMQMSDLYLDNIIEGIDFDGVHQNILVNGLYMDGGVTATYYYDDSQAIDVNEVRDCVITNVVARNFENFTRIVDKHSTWPTYAEMYAANGAGNPNPGTVFTSKNVTISNLSLQDVGNYRGYPCIAFGGGNRFPPDPGDGLLGIAERISITNATFTNCGPIVIARDAKDTLLSNIKMFNTVKYKPDTLNQFGAIKIAGSDPVLGGEVSVKLENILIDKCDNIGICIDGSKSVVLDGIVLRNVNTGSSEATSGAPATAKGIEIKNPSQNDLDIYTRDVTIESVAITTGTAHSIYYGGTVGANHLWTSGDRMRLFRRPSIDTVNAMARTKSSATVHREYIDTALTSTIPVVLLTEAYRLLLVRVYIVSSIAYVATATDYTHIILEKITPTGSVHVVTYDLTTPAAAGTEIDIGMIPTSPHTDFNPGDILRIVFWKVGAGSSLGYAQIFTDYLRYDLI